MILFQLLRSVFTALLLTLTQYQSLCLPRSSYYIFYALLFAYFHTQGPTMIVKVEQMNMSQENKSMLEDQKEKESEEV